jgi:NAD(P)H dehydrogenase (quinone)
MKVSVILAHPDPSSFNHAIAHEAVSCLKRNGHDIILHDLCRERFDPVIPAGEILEKVSLPAAIQEHCRETGSADGIIIVHPNWWGQPPAILKGWIDRVLRPGTAYRFLEGDSGEGVPVGLLNARTALVFNTSNTLPEREKAVFGDPLQLIWEKCIFELCGVKEFHREMFTPVVTSTLEQRLQWLASVRVVVDRFFPSGAKSNRN